MRHFFLRDTKHFPVACVATERLDSAADGAGGKLTYGISICNPLDFQKFDSRRAMHIATKRLNYFMAGRYDKNQNGDRLHDPTVPDFESAKCGVVMFQQGESPKMKLLTTLLEDNDLPSRFRRAVKHEIAVLRQRMEQRRLQEAAELASHTPPHQPPAAAPQ